MKELYLKGTTKTPNIYLSDGLIKFEGKSIPEDPKKFYKPIINWIKEYLANPKDQTEIRIRMDYCDTGSTKILFDILKLLADYTHSNVKREMNFYWEYERGDGDILELGEFLENKLPTNFNFVELPDV